MTCRGKLRGRTGGIKTMLAGHGARVEIEVEVIKEPHGTEHYRCDEKLLSELIQTSWKGSNILVTGLPGIGKTLLCENLAQLLVDSQQPNVYKYENIDELRRSKRRHFNSHENHEQIILVDNVTSTQLDGWIIENTQNTTTIVFSRTLLVYKFSCVVRIKGSKSLPLWDEHSTQDDYSLWDNHIDVLCCIPFLLISFKTFFSKSVPRHDIYFLLLATYVNYCQTLQVSLFSDIKEVPGKVKKFLKDIADVAYSSLSKNGEEFIDDDELWKLYDVGDEVGVVTQTSDGRWRFIFQGLADCLTAFKLYWISEEQFDKDTRPENIKVPLEAMKLFKEMRTDSRSALSTKSILDIDITLQPVGGEVTLGGSVSLVCSASILGPPGMALPTFLWFKNGKALVGEVLNKLIIEEASEKDTGIYVCYVSDVHDKVNKVSKPAQISVKSIQPPAIVPKSIITEKHTEDHLKPSSTDYQVVLKELDTEIKNHLDITSLLPYLMKHQLLSSTDQYVLSNDYLTPSDRAERLLMSIKVKGQDGYDKFVTCLKEEQEHMGHHHLLTLINRRGVSNLNKKSKDVTSRQLSSLSGSTNSSITITTQPEPQVECKKGEEAIIMCGATGMAPLRYEWYKDERCVSRDQVLELKYINEEDVGQYRCKITDGYDNVWTNPTIVKLKAAEPASLKQDLELTDRKLSEVAGELSHIGEKWEKLGFYLNVDQNTIARIRYEQRNTMSKIYQLLRRWRDKTRDASWSQLEQAIRWIGASLQQPHLAGATSLYGASNIPAPTFSFEAPVILKHPDDQIGILEGGPITLEIKARGAPPLSYQWYCNNRPIQGASRAYYYITRSTINDTGDYHCQVKNLYGVADSYTARVYISTGVTGGFLISRKPPDGIKYPPSNLALLSNTPSLIEGTQSTPASLDKTLKNSTNPEKCLFEPPEKQVMSLPTKDLTANGKVIILEHPQGGTYRVGDPLTLVCRVEGAQPIHYRWELNNMSLTHERKPQLYIPQLTIDDEGWYRCQVSNMFGRTYSDSCRVVVRNAK